MAKDCSAHKSWLARSFPRKIIGSFIIGLTLLAAPARAITTGGVASASSYYVSGDNTPAKAFDGNTTTLGWGNNGSAMPHWLMYTFDTPKVVTNYAMICSASQIGGWTSENYNPKTWTFEGSNATSGGWITLDTIADGLLTMDQWKSFPIVNSTAYTKYRIYVTATESGNWLRITEMELYYIPTLSVSATGATSPGPTNATLNGTVNSTGLAENPEVYICWGYADAGTTSTGDWDHLVALGTNWGMGQSFSTNITGLISGSNYAYRCYVTNSVGKAWSATAPTFAPLYTGPSTRTWNGSQDGNWFNDNNWTPSPAPSAGDSVIIPGVGNAILLSNSTPALVSLTIGTNTLTFTNWDTTINAATVIVQNAGVLTLPAAFAEGQMSNRVHIACIDFTLAAGGSINADGKGYLNVNGPGKGESVSAGDGGGGAYGGKGGRGYNYYRVKGGTPYGAIDAPLLPGSGGGGTNYGGAGGGAVYIEATGAVVINGAISANGNQASDTYRGGGGSGGGIYITCAIFGGTTGGLLRANGGDTGLYGAGLRYCGGGGGGRIAVNYAALGTPHAARFQTTRGLGWTDKNPGDLLDAPSVYWEASEHGSLFLPDAALLTSPLTDGLFSNVNLTVTNLTAWNVNALSINDCAFTFSMTNFQLRVTNDLVIGAGGALGTRGSLIDVSGSLVVTNGGTLAVYSLPTNGLVDYGTLVSVTGNLTIGSSSWIYPCSDPVSGGSVLFRANGFSVGTNGGIDALARGFKSQSGPGQGNVSATNLLSYGSGASHAGLGGRAYSANTNSWVPAGCGSLTTPLLAGSGGGNSNFGGYGGGVIRIEAQNSAVVNGTLKADGGGGSQGSGGGGSGGSVYLSCQALSGSGTLSARGGVSGYEGQNWAGGGGGGRIALAYSALGTPSNLHFNTGGGIGYAESNPENRGPWDARWHLASTPGTVYWPDRGLLNETITDNVFTGVNLYIGAITALSLNSLAIDNASLAFAPTGFSLTVSNNMTINTAGNLNLLGNLTVGGNLTLTNGGTLQAYGLATNSFIDYSLLVTIQGNTSIGAGSWIYPYAQEYNGGAVVFRMQNLTIDTNAGFNANGRGFRETTGPGQSNLGSGYGGGGGYGGKGGNSYIGTLGGAVYGASNLTIYAGSGGGGQDWINMRGGGSVRIEAEGQVALDGTIKANGITARDAWYWIAGGAGGGITIMAKTFSGTTNAELRATGGRAGIYSGTNCYAGGGGGGRISVWSGVSASEIRARVVAGQPVTGVTGATNSPFYLGAMSVTNGIGWAELPPSLYTQPGPGDFAQAGSIAFYTVPGISASALLMQIQ